MTSLIESINIPTEELERLSGPSVWPSTSAETAWDRCIHRRPELRYLLARQRQDGRRETKKLGSAGTMEIVILQVGGRSARTKKRMETTVGRFHHPINGSNRKADVQSFLVELRNSLRRRMPREASFGRGIRLQFKDKDVGHLADFREEWL